ncbi:two-component response regulator [Geomicrobium sp. JCM 19037]|nr:two-component response regulator [Geomicrobium sp. JCM 19037]
MTILLVEDDKTIALGLEYSLQQEGFETIHAVDVASAKSMISASIESISLCLLDLSLPDGSGYELCELVKGKKDIPVIFLTVVDDEVNVVMGLDMARTITLPSRFEFVS